MTTMTTHATLLALFTARLPEATPGDVAEALVAKFRAAEARHGRTLPLGYAHVMLFHHHADRVRAARIAVRAAERAVVAQAQGIEDARRVDAFVQAALELDTLAGADFVRRLTHKQAESIAILRLLVIDGEEHETVARLFGLTLVTAYQRLSRIRKILRPHAVALGFTALVEVGLDSRVSPHGGALGFK
jgi:DNA-directed RNA polymerase specialized sigma24 family protein